MRGTSPLSEEPPPAQLGWGLKSALRKRLLMLLGIAEKRENSFIQAVNEMSFAIHFHGLHVADPQHPRVAPAHGVGVGGGVILGETFLEGEKMHKSIETQLLCPQGLGALFAMAAAAR